MMFNILLLPTVLDLSWYEGDLGLSPSVSNKNTTIKSYYVINILNISTHDGVLIILSQMGNRHRNITWVLSTGSMAMDPV